MTIELSGRAQIDRTSPLYSRLLGAATRLASKDSTLWGVQAQVEAEVRLNWVDLPRSSRSLIPEISELVEWAESAGLTNIILSGMGGSSLAPEVMSKSYQKKITVLDTTDPDQIQQAIPQSLRDTVLIIGSKSGSTVETASHKALFEKLLLDEGLQPSDHLVIVTDPGSPFDQSAQAEGLRIINADPNVGGRYSALSAFGLVPAALMGIDISELLADAEQAAETFTTAQSVAVGIAALIFAAGEQNIGFSDRGSVHPGLSDWIEQLIAESTGKNERGRLPIVLESLTAPLAGPGLLISLGGSAESTSDLIVTGTLGEHFILWEWVTALLALALEVDPFNQPNVTEAKERTNSILEKWANGGQISPTPSYEDSNLQIFSTSTSSSLSEQFDDFFFNDSHYIAIMAYLARGIDDEVAKTRAKISTKTGRGTTFGWGPRFLHSTGQFHKGGQQNGAFIQITGENEIDIDIPGRSFTFHTLLMAQALGDGEALTDRALPVMRIHLKNRRAGIAQILDALK